VARGAARGSTRSWHRSACEAGPASAAAGRRRLAAAPRASCPIVPDSHPTGARRPRRRAHRSRGGAGNRTRSRAGRSSLNWAEKQQIDACGCPEPFRYFPSVSVPFRRSRVTIWVTVRCASCWATPTRPEASVHTPRCGRPYAGSNPERGLALQDARQRPQIRAVARSPASRHRAVVGPRAPVGLGLSDRQGGGGLVFTCRTTKKATRRRTATTSGAHDDPIEVVGASSPGGGPEP
jgi:hypothetical protein